MNSEITDCQKLFAKCKVVLLDVAGTTTSQAFVRDTLFTYVTGNVEPFLKDNWENDDVKTALNVLNGTKEVETPEAAIQLIKTSIDKLSDNIGLKVISGLVYKKGYEDGTLKAHVYSDVPTAFASWSKDKKIAIYSTGSVESQKLLFKHSVEGDLTAHISHYFDQGAGLKTANQSYSNIAKEMNVNVEDVLWISDLKEELAPAKEVGMATLLINRDSNKSDTADFIQIESFDQLTAENYCKRKIENEPNLEIEPPSKIFKKDESNEEDKVENADLKPTTNGVTEEVKNEEANKKEDPVDKMEVETKESNLQTSENGNSEITEDVVEKMETDEAPKTDTDENVSQTSIDTIKDIANAPQETKVAEAKPDKIEEKETIVETKTEEPLGKSETVETHPETVNETVVKCDKEDEKVVEVKDTDKAIDGKNQKEVSQIISDEDTSDKNEKEVISEITECKQSENTSSKKNDEDNKITEEKVINEPIETAENDSSKSTDKSEEKEIDKPTETIKSEENGSITTDKQETVNTEENDTSKITNSEEKDSHKATEMVKSEENGSSKITNSEEKDAHKATETVKSEENGSSKTDKCEEKETTNGEESASTTTDKPEETNNKPSEPESNEIAKTAKPGSSIVQEAENLTNGKQNGSTNGIEPVNGSDDCDKTAETQVKKIAVEPAAVSIEV